MCVCACVRACVRVCVCARVALKGLSSFIWLPSRALAVARPLWPKGLPASGQKIIVVRVRLHT